MEQIYLIEDCNALKYVGRTKDKLKYRLGKHKYDKKRKNCSSKQLDLENCTIRCLDIADSAEEAMELEWFYINSIDCVNQIKFNYDQKEYDKKYREKNKDKIKEYNKKYREKNKDKIKEYMKEYYQIKKQTLVQAGEH